MSTEPPNIAAVAPLVSVAMSVRNVEVTIGRALRSLISQTHENWELRLINDGSTDGTLREIARVVDRRITLINHAKAAGLPTRLNEAIAASHGRYIARMDGDDVCYPERFTRQVAVLEANPDIDLIGTGAMAFQTSGIPLGTFQQPKDHQEICAHPQRGFPMPHPTWMGRAEWFQRYPYDETARRAQDQTTLLKAYKTSRYANLPEVLFAYQQDTPTLNSIIGSRWHYARALMDHGRKTRAWSTVAEGLIQQVTRASYAAAQLKLGRSEAILARRFAPPSPQERAHFEAVIAALAPPA
jgi:glycosyltransferase involved in cell wall biosynthesis